MRVLIAAVGRLKAGPERELCERYLQRLAAVGPPVGITVAVREIPESRAANAVERRRQEAAALSAQIGAGARIIALDERGAAPTSAGFAQDLGRARETASSIFAFVIGGPDGLDPDWRSSVAGTLGFGSMTWPHQLARAMLLEQIYRAATILSGHPYHRG